jgi:hypothetical protein
MQEPVMSKYGHHFERFAVLQHIEGGNLFCPVTGNPLRRSDLIPNKTLQWKIKVWAEKNGLDISGETEDRSGMAPLARRSGFDAVPAPPARFLCPLTRNIMKDPVMTEDGIIFERHAIVKWLRSSPEGTCPVTAKPLLRSGLVSNLILQREIEQWEQMWGNVLSGNGEKNDMGEVAETGSLSSSLKDSSGSELCPRDMIRSLPMNLYIKENDKRIKYLRIKKKSLMDALDSAIKCSTGSV